MSAGQSVQATLAVRFLHRHEERVVVEPGRLSRQNASKRSMTSGFLRARS
jgi:hypothetical protein